MNNEIKGVHAPTKVIRCTEYEQNPLNIVGSRVVTTLGQTDGRADRWIDGAGHGPNVIG